MNLCPHCNQPVDDSGVAFDVGLLMIAVNGTGYHLGSAHQAAIVEILFKRFGKAVSREAILEHVYCLLPNDWPDIKIIDVFVCRLRKLLRDQECPLEIATKWGVGYILRRKDVQVHSKPLLAPRPEGSAVTV